MTPNALRTIPIDSSLLPFPASFCPYNLYCISSICVPSGYEFFTHHLYFLSTPYHQQQSRVAGLSFATPGAPPANPGVETPDFINSTRTTRILLSSLRASGHTFKTSSSLLKKNYLHDFDIFESLVVGQQYLRHPTLPEIRKRSTLPTIHKIIMW